MVRGRMRRRCGATVTRYGEPSAANYDISDACVSRHQGNINVGGSINVHLPYRQTERQDF